jgi:hypothetical protein
LLTRPIQFLYVVLLAFSLPAQDTRNVTEPVIPAPCAALTARLSTAGIDETALDTNRIQQAIDSCPAGHAVKLVAHGNFNAFLSGPLQLRSGVTLQVDKGAILFGSRNPRDYEGFQGDGFTVWGVAIFSPKTARNTDGIDPANSGVRQCDNQRRDEKFRRACGLGAWPGAGEFPAGRLGRSRKRPTRFNFGKPRDVPRQVCADAE